MKINDQIDIEQKRLIRQAIDNIRITQNYLKSVEECLENSNQFPYYLSDAQEALKVVGLLAARHAALGTLKWQFANSKLRLKKK